MSELIFSQNLRLLMGRRGLKQTTLADAVGVTQGAVSGWLSGSIPKSDVLLKLARALGTTAEELLDPFEQHLQDLRETSSLVEELPGPISAQQRLFDELSEWKARARDAERDVSELRKKVAEIAAQLQRIASTKQCK